MSNRKKAHAVECPVCLLKMSSKRIERHHIKPQRAGGTNDPDNMISLCVMCHDLVDRIMPDELYMWMTEDEYSEVYNMWDQVTFDALIAMILLSYRPEDIPAEWFTSKYDLHRKLKPDFENFGVWVREIWDEWPRYHKVIVLKYYAVAQDVLSSREKVA